MANIGINAARGRIAELEEALDSGVSPDHVEHGRSLLRAAVDGGALASVELLLARGAKPAIDILGAACSAGRYEIVALLLAAGAPPAEGRGAPSAEWLASIIAKVKGTALEGPSLYGTGVQGLVAAAQWERMTELVEAGIELPAPNLWAKPPQPDPRAVFFAEAPDALRLRVALATSSVADVLTFCAGAGFAPGVRALLDRGADASRASMEAAAARCRDEAVFEVLRAAGAPIDLGAARQATLSRNVVALAWLHRHDPTVFQQAMEIAGKQETALKLATRLALEESVAFFASVGLLEAGATAKARRARKQKAARAADAPESAKRNTAKREARREQAAKAVPPAPAPVCRELERLGFTLGNDPAFDASELSPKARWVAQLRPPTGAFHSRTNDIGAIEFCTPRLEGTEIVIGRGRRSELVVAAVSGDHPRFLASDSPPLPKLAAFLKSLAGGEHGPTSPVASPVLTQIERLGGVPVDGAPREVMTVAGKQTLSPMLSGFARVEWPAERTYLVGDPETIVSFGLDEITEPLAEGHSGPLVAIGYDELQYYYVARAEDTSADPTIHRLDHDGSSRLGYGERLSAILRRVKFLSSRPTTSVKGALFDAIRALDAQASLALLHAHRGKIPEKVDSSGLTFLHYATLAQLPDVVDELIAQGHSVRTSLRAETLSVPRYFGWNRTPHTTRGQTPLHAAMSGNPKRTDGGPNIRIIRALLAAGADPNGLNEFGQTPLLLAVRGNDDCHEAVVTLIAAGADPNLAAQHGCPLSAAGLNVGHVRALLVAGANPNTFRGPFQTLTGATLLHRAAWWGAVDLVEALLEHGADPELVTADGKRPLDVARGNAGYVLMQHGGA